LSQSDKPSSKRLVESDVVMLDNMLAAHARDPFEGTRKMAVAMGDIYHREQLDEKVDAEIPTQAKEEII